MAVEDNPPPPPPPTPTDKIIPFSIPNKVPIKLDLEKHNYNSWSSFSLIHLGSLGLKSHVETDTASTNPEWCQLDDLIKMWILRSLCDFLQEQVGTTSGNAKALWDHLKNLFHDNKDARAINLDNELRSIKIGKMTVNEYCTKIQAMSNRHKNLDCEVSEKNMVIFAVNGLDSRFATLAEIIRHREPLPTFETARNMLLLKESSFNDDSTSTTFESSSSSLTILMASSSSNTKVLQSEPMTTVQHNVISAWVQLLSVASTDSLPCVSTMSITRPTWNMDTSIIPSHHRPLHLHNVLVTPNIIKNLISVRQFTRDNNCTIEFDAFGFSVKDFLTRHILLRCDSSGDLYPVTKSSNLPVAFVSTSSSTWHQRLGHPGDEVLRSLTSRRFISCNKEKSSHVCHACQLGKHVKLPFHSSDYIVTKCFDIIHSDLWTSPIHKFHADGTLSHYKARLVANGSNQQHGVDFDETFMYMHQPPGFVDSRYPNHVCLLVLTVCKGSQVAYLLIYVDDIILTTSSPVLLQQIIGSLHKEFDMTDLGALNYFLGISAVRHRTWLFLSQKKYALHLLELCSPLDAFLLDPTFIKPQSRQDLQYLTFTRPDLSYAVQQICLYMHDPRESYFAALKRILRYVQGTLELGLHLYASATTSLVGYNDADWAGCPSTRRSTSGYCVFLGDNLLLWSAKRKHTISRSSAEAEYRGVANIVAETAWLRNLLRELHSPLLTTTLAGHVRVLHVPSRFQYADIFTKGFPSTLFEDFRSSLSVRPLPAQTARAY
ncbi:ribonuclease H-like domain-containing protein [Tanacetum coccineum]